MKTSSSKNEGIKNQHHLALDHVNAFLENEFLVSEMVGIRESESSSFLKNMWEQSALRVRQGIFHIPATLFRSPGNLSTIDQLYAFSESGKRSSLITSDSIVSGAPVQLKAGYAFVMSVWLEQATVEKFRGGMQFYSRSPQQTVDLLNLAHRLSELMLLPAVVFFNQNSNQIEYPEVELLSLEDARNFLGFPRDEIVSPTEIQISLFGQLRRRLPLLTREDRQFLDQRLFNELPVFFPRIAQEYARITGRKYGFWELVGKDSAEVMIIASGNVFNWLNEHAQSLRKGSASTIGLLHPTLINPFPGSEYVKLLEGKKAVIVLNRTSEGETGAIFNELQLSFQKALVNGRSGKGDKKAPYPHYPALTVAQIPEMISVSIPEAKFDVQELQKIINQVAKKSHDSVLFSVNPLSLKEPPPVKRKAAKILTITFRSRDAYFPARRIANLLKYGLDVHCHLTSSKDAFPVQLILSPQPVAMGWDQPADMLVSTRFDVKRLSTDLQRVKEKGVALLEGNPELPGDSWAQLPHSVRKLISDKKLRLYFIDFQVPDPEKGTVFRMNEAKIEAVLLGALVKILETEFSEFVAREKMKAVVNAFTSNNEPGFAEAFSIGYQNCQLIDYTQLQFDEIPPAPDTSTPLFREEELLEGLEPQTENPEVLRQLMNFYYEAAGFDSPFTSEGVESLIPPHFYQFRNLDLARYDFPIIIFEDDSQTPIRPLKDVFDEIMESVSLEGDEKEHLRHTLLLMEVKIKTRLREKPAVTLTELWQTASENLLQEFRDDPEKLEQYQKDLQLAEQQLNLNGRVYNCSERAVSHALYHLSMQIWQQKISSFREDLDELISRLNGILSADYQKKPEAKTPDKLRESVGSAYADELDFEEMSELLEEVPIFGEPLSEKRRNRIQETLNTLHSLKTLFHPEANPESFIEQRWDSLLSLNSHNCKCAAALGHFESQIRSLTDFFRAVRIARLEVENQYREDKHDAYFAEFGLENLSLEEIELFPPFPVRLVHQPFDEKTAHALLSLLSSGLPLKVLLIIDDLCSGIPAPGRVGCARDWFNFIAQMLIPLNNVFILQTTSSNYSYWAKGFEEGLKYNGPALFFIYDGNMKDFNIQEPYLISAAAHESRSFPALLFNPGAGENWSERFSIAGNPDVDKDWSSMEIAVAQNGDQEPQTRELPFTVIDYLVIDRRYSRYFMVVPRAFWHQNMVYLTDFLKIAPEETTYKIPYIWMTDDSGVLHRVAIARELIDALRKTLNNWHLLQELSGVKSSIARKLLQEELKKFEEEKQNALAELEAKYQQELEKAVDAVAQQIVSNIAAGLLSEGAFPAASGAVVSPVSMPTPSPAAPAEAPPAEQVEEAPTEVKTEEEEEEIISLDEPYIETPRCTSCNECINRNPQIFAYNENKQAYIKDPTAGPYRDIVEAAEKCPVHIIHPGKPKNPDEPGLEELLERAKPYL